MKIDVESAKDANGAAALALMAALIEVLRTSGKVSRGEIHAVQAIAKALLGGDRTVAQDARAAIDEIV